MMLIAACLIGFGIYLSDPHTADAEAQERISHPSQGVAVNDAEENITFVPEGNIKAGIVYYPGMKIRGGAYSLMADALAGEGYLCVLVNMPLNMSVLNSDAALSITKQWPDVKDWYIGGDSMGGQSAQKCVLDHPGVFKGLITVARQLDYDFSDNETPILGIYGSHDQICTAEDTENDASNTNEACYTEVMIEGGTHGYFGNYGIQQWDGEPGITREEQMKQTVDAILSFLEHCGN